MNALCHKPNPPPTQLRICLRRITSGPDADSAFLEMHNAMLRYSETVASRIVNQDDRHQHVELSGADVKVQKTMILEALRFLAHGNWEITEGGETCQDTTT